ncbi:hypothetical protein DL96DRAFT_1611391, partial [Flagelloscypha sp. PMI_526]
MLHAPYPSTAALWPGLPSLFIQPDIYDIVAYFGRSPSSTLFLETSILRRRYKPLHTNILLCCRDCLPIIKTSLVRWWDVHSHLDSLSRSKNPCQRSQRQHPRCSGQLFGSCIALDIVWLTTSYTIFVKRRKEHHSTPSVRILHCVSSYYCYLTLMIIIFNTKLIRGDHYMDMDMLKVPLWDRSMWRRHERENEPLE